LSNLRAASPSLPNLPKCTFFPLIWISAGLIRPANAGSEVGALVEIQLSIPVREVGVGVGSVLFSSYEAPPLSSKPPCSVVLELHEQPPAPRASRQLPAVGLGWLCSSRGARSGFKRAAQNRTRPGNQREGISGCAMKHAAKGEL
jgi:hypothetical protein